MPQQTASREGSGPIHDNSVRGRMYWSPEQEALLTLLRSADLAKNRFSHLFEDAGITFQQYNVLRILRGAGEQGLPTLEVGKRMIERTPGVTRIIDRLKAKGLVERQRGAVDRRRVWCRLSAPGLALLDRLDGPVSRTDLSIFEGMPRSELKLLTQTLERLSSRLSTIG
ncbi:MAG: MarR family transcriptional regulator [Gemmatimonadetes bacterium]|nr:MarR family transcriptional regulator [Gemmatimonadota bacterium]